MTAVSTVKSYQKIVILAHLVLKRILEYSLGTQKKFNP